MSNITLNIVEPGSGPTPAPVVPNTGLFTGGASSPEATAITAVSAVLILTIAVIVLAFLYRKQKKSGKVIKLVHIVDSTKAVLKSKKRITAGLSAIALLASAGTLTTLLASANKNNTNAVEENGLTLDVSSEDLTIEVGDSPVFAVLPVELTVKEATEAGYTLTAYADSTDLVSTTDSSKVIPMITLPEAGGELSALTNNTYGLALEEEPTTKDAEVYMPLSTDSSTPTILKATDYVETEANDTTTIYYGFYITPDIPYGTYTGTNINYNVEPHYITNLSFNGNGNDGGEEIESRIIPAGDTITLPENTYTKEGYNFIGWNTVAEGTGKAYADKAEFTASLDKSEDVTLYAQWKKNAPYMQDVANWGNTLVEDVIVEAVDSRDGKTYKVAKLKDGKIWMVQNLDLEKEGLLDGVTLDSTNTDNPASGFNLPASQVDVTDENRSWGSSSSQADIETAHIYDLAAGGTVYKYCINFRQGSCIEYGNNIPVAELGNFYNWYTATAGTGTYSTGSTQEGPFEATGSICPAGWKLPNNSNSSEATDYSTLLSLYGITESPASSTYINTDKAAIFKAPLSFTPSGDYNSGLDHIGDIGYLWSPLVSDNYQARVFFYYAGFANPWFSVNKTSGRAVRCVAR